MSRAEVRYRRTALALPVQTHSIRIESWNRNTERSDEERRWLTKCIIYRKERVICRVRAEGWLGAASLLECRTEESHT